MNARLVLMHALSPVHCGTGQSVGGIDLPIARERPTNIPIVPGSSLKGVLRARAVCDGIHKEAFGPEKEAGEHAGAVQFSDLHLAFLPVRSVRGVFAWVTSPYLVRRLVRDAREAGLPWADLSGVEFTPRVAKAYVTDETLASGGKVLFEDMAFTAAQNDSFTQVAREVARSIFTEADRPDFVRRACLVSDDTMSILLETATELTTRNRLDPESRTVADGQLWTEEALPVESLLAGLVVATPLAGQRTPAAALLDHVVGLAGQTAVQVGGKASVGRGLVRLRFAEGGRK